VSQTLKGGPTLSFSCAIDAGIAFVPAVGAYTTHRKEHFQLSVTVTRPRGDIYLAAGNGRAEKASEFRFGLEAIHCEDPSKAVAITQTSNSSPDMRKERVAGKATYSLPRSIAPVGNDGSTVLAIVIFIQANCARCVDRGGGARVLYSTQRNGICLICRT
jgi:hypothetical protein